jgi:hypothetical protein
MLKDGGGSAYPSFQALLGRGDGGFFAARPVGPGPSFGPIPADVNGDGRDDVLLITDDPCGPNEIRTYLGDGHGNFTPAGSIATGFYARDVVPAGIGPTDVRVADLDADGLPDLVATNLSGYAAVLAGRGGGVFGAATNFGLFGVPRAFVDGDFDGDTLTDLFVISCSGAFVL